MHSAHFHAGDVDRHVSVLNPLGQHLARPTRTLNANRIETASDKQITYFSGFTQQVAVIRREALRAVKPGGNAGGLQNRNAFHRFAQDGLEVIKVLG